MSADKDAGSRTVTFGLVPNHFFVVNSFNKTIDHLQTVTYSCYY